MTISYTFYDQQKPITILLLHGFLGSHRDWEPYIPSLLEHGNLIVLDLPGHGRSPISHTTSLKQTATHIHRILTACAAHTKWIIIGYSLGGRIAHQLGFLAKKQLLFMIYISANISGLSPHDQVARRQLDTRLSQSLRTDYKGFLKKWYDMALFDSPKFSFIRDSKVKACLNQDPHRLAIALKQFSPGVSNSSHTPVWPYIYIAGEYDVKYVKLGMAHVLAPYNHGVYIIRDSAHLCYLERPTTVLPIILGYITPFNADQ